MQGEFILDGVLEKHHKPSSSIDEIVRYHTFRVMTCGYHYAVVVLFGFSIVIPNTHPRRVTRVFHNDHAAIANFNYLHD